MVTRWNDNEIQVDEFDRWAAPLTENFWRVVAENLSVLMSTSNVSMYPRRIGSVDYRVMIDVLRFDGDDGRDVRLSARWILYKENGPEILVMRKSNFVKPAGEEEDFTALVRAMSDVTADLSREIADEIKKWKGR